uniref:Taste receptor type 2 n=1 Tax=Latimeria chalumnae TaxID=7897 RepID=H2ZZB4_LATCH
MVTTDAIPELAVRLTLIFFGIIGNLLIVRVYFLEYRISKALQPTELVVTILASINVLQPISLFLPIIRLQFFCRYIGEGMVKLIDIILIFFSKMSYWFTAWLCFFYYVQIVKVNWKVFLRLKQRISLVVKFLIICTLIVCFILSVPVIRIIKFTPNDSYIPKQCQNIYIRGKATFIYTVVLTVLTSLLPLAVMVVSSLNIVIFLCRHSRNMTKNVTTIGSSHSNAYTTIAIMLISLIILYVVCTSTVVAVNLQVSVGDLDILTAIAITSSFYSAGSAVILSIGTLKIRQHCIKVCCIKWGSMLRDQHI